jgi:tetratricopeptide (TPR) repeat protein
LKPRNASFRVDRAELHVAKGHWELASRDYRTAIRLDKKLGRAYHGAAWLMATCPDSRYRNPKLALYAARKAIQLDDSRDYRYLDTLAAAQAALGHFEKAKVSLASAIESAPDEAARRMKYRLALYEKEEPFRERPAVVTASFE